MDDATQKLVDEELFLTVDRFQSGLIDKMELIEAVERWRHADRTALEAAQRPPFNPPHESVCRCSATGNGECIRPPVSPEVRDAIRAEVKRTLNVHRGVVGHHKLSEILADAILARLSIPSQPVYDEEKIARFLAEHVADVDETSVYEGSCLCGWKEPGWHFPTKRSLFPEWDATAPGAGFEEHVAAALVAALRGGELTREETNE